MASQVLLDAHSKRIGEIKEVSGKLIILDAHSIRKGEYDPKTNITRDAAGRTVGKGNLLTTLL